MLVLLVICTLLLNQVAVEVSSLLLVHVDFDRFFFF